MTSEIPCEVIPPGTRAAVGRRGRSPSPRAFPASPEARQSPSRILPHPPCLPPPDSFPIRMLRPLESHCFSELRNPLRIQRRPRTVRSWTPPAGHRVPHRPRAESSARGTPARSPGTTTTSEISCAAISPGPGRLSDAGAAHRRLEPSPPRRKHASPLPGSSSTHHASRPPDSFPIRMLRPLEPHCFSELPNPLRIERQPRPEPCVPGRPLRVIGFPIGLERNPPPGERQQEVLEPQQLRRSPAQRSPRDQGGCRTPRPLTAASSLPRHAGSTRVHFPDPPSSPGFSPPPLPPPCRIGRALESCCFNRFRNPLRMRRQAVQRLRPLPLPPPVPGTQPQCQPPPLLTPPTNYRLPRSPARHLLTLYASPAAPPCPPFGSAPEKTQAGPPEHSTPAPEFELAPRRIRLLYSPSGGAGRGGGEVG
jgi:hypothetical protein